MVSATIYLIVLLSSFLFLLFAGLSKNSDEGFYGLLAGFFLILMTGILGFASPVSIDNGDSITTNYNYVNGTLTSTTETVTPNNTSEDSTLYYVFNITMVLVGVGGLYQTMMERREVKMMEEY